jgi:hypothetical protein
MSNETEVLHMRNYNTLGHNLKRGLFTFCDKVSAGLHKPEKKFVFDMIYGILSGQSCILTDIARKLKENIALDKLVERLSRNLMNLEAEEELTNNYFQTIKRNFDYSTILIIDDSDISKPYSSKLEGLCRVKDGSTGEIKNGYWYAGVSALTAEHKQPIPVYSRVYSSQEKGYVSNNAETIASLKYLTSHFPKTTIRALDRGYDAGYIFDYLVPRKESFIVRMDERNVIYKGEKILLSKLARRFKGKYLLKFESKDGKKADCKISIKWLSI